MSNAKYMSSDDAMDDLSRYSFVGGEWFKKSRFQYFRDIDFVCEHACRRDYQNLKYCSKNMRDNANVVLAAMFLCCDEFQARCTLIYASKRLQDKVNKLISEKPMNIEQALYVIATVEDKINKFKEQYPDEQ